MRLAVSLTTWWYQTFWKLFVRSLEALLQCVFGSSCTVCVWFQDACAHWFWAEICPTSAALHLPSLICTSTSSHPRICRSTFTSSQSHICRPSFFLSLYISLFLPSFFLNRFFVATSYSIPIFTSPSTTALCLFSYLELLDNHLFRSRANRRLVPFLT